VCLVIGPDEQRQEFSGADARLCLKARQNLYCEGYRLVKKCMDAISHSEVATGYGPINYSDNISKDVQYVAQ
jgi:hypothetical protein